MEKHSVQLWLKSYSCQPWGFVVAARVMFSFLVRLVSEDEFESTGLYLHFFCIHATIEYSLLQSATSGAIFFRLTYANNQNRLPFPRRSIPY